MTPKIKKVSNPLTVIAIFAGLAEVAGTVALPLVSAQNQTTFMWYVMLFPAVLVVLFFATLFYDHTILYAPSDFSDENNFNLLANKLRIQNEISEMSALVRESKEELSKVENKIEPSYDDIVVNEVNKKLDQIEYKLNSTKKWNIDTTVTVILKSAFDKLSSEQKELILFIKDQQNGASLEDIKKIFPFRQTSELVNDIFYLISISFVEHRNERYYTIHLFKSLV